MKLQSVPYVVLVASGKGGVGKTTVASDMARVAADHGYSAGLIDADISTPNTPEVVGGEGFDASDERLSTHDAITPPEVNGIQVVSQGMVLPDDVPVLRDGTWRAEAVADYIEHVEWAADTDIVVVDTPPGTGEELQVIASEAPPDHAFVVTTPHPSSLRDATKTHEFFEQANVRHRAVMNMAYIPSDDIVDHVLDTVDFTDIAGVGDAKSDSLVELAREKAADYAMFDYDGDTTLPFDTELAATVPYTDDYEARKAVYVEAVKHIFDKEEVEL